MIVLPASLCTDDHDRNAVFAVLQLVLAAAEKTVGKTAGKQKGQQEEEIQKIIAVRNCFSLHSEQVDPCAVDRTRHKTCHHKVLKLCLACKCPQAVIETEQIKYEQCDHNPDGQKWRIGSKNAAGTVLTSKSYRIRIAR